LFSKKIKIQKKKIKICKKKEEEEEKVEGPIWKPSNILL
jgi:hypothetical protein